MHTQLTASKQANIAASEPTSFAGEYCDAFGYVFSISQEGSAITVTSNPKRPETPASGTVKGNIAFVWGLTGTRLDVSGEIAWSNGVVWGPFPP